MHLINTEWNPLFTTEGRISLLPLEEREIYKRCIHSCHSGQSPDMKYTLDDYRELVMMLSLLMVRRRY